MIVAAALSVLATPLPSPVATPADASPTLGSPGLIGFIVTFAVAVGVIVILRSMVRRLRRVNAAPEPDGPDAPVAVAGTQPVPDAGPTGRGGADG